MKSDRLTTIIDSDHTVAAEKALGFGAVISTYSRKPGVVHIFTRLQAVNDHLLEMNARPERWQCFGYPHNGTFVLCACSLEGAITLLANCGINVMREE